MKNDKNLEIAIVELVNQLTNEDYMQDLFQSEEVEYFGFESDSIAFKLFHQKLFMKNQKYELLFYAQSLQKKVLVKSSSSVKQVQDGIDVYGDPFQVVVFNLTQYDKDDWEDFKFIIQKRDKEVQKLFKAVRGY